MSGGHILSYSWPSNHLSRSRICGLRGDNRPANRLRQETRATTLGMSVISPEFPQGRLKQGARLTPTPQHCGSRETPTKLPANDNQNAPSPNLTGQVQQPTRGAPGPGSPRSPLSLLVRGSRTPRFSPPFRARRFGTWISPLHTTPATAPLPSGSP